MKKQEIETEEIVDFKNNLNVYDEWSDDFPMIEVNIYIINRIGEKYFCTKGIDKSLEGVEFMFVYTNISMDPYNKMCDYLNKCENIDPCVWSSFDTRDPRNHSIPKEILNDFISVRRRMKIKNILSKNEKKYFLF